MYFKFISYIKLRTKISHINISEIIPYTSYDSPKTQVDKTARHSGETRLVCDNKIIKMLCYLKQDHEKRAKNPEISFPHCLIN